MKQSHRTAEAAIARLNPVSVASKSLRSFPEASVWKANWAVGLECQYATLVHVN